MTRIIRITATALAALAVAAPVATAMPTDPVGKPPAGLTVSPQSGANDTQSACPAGTRAVHGSAGAGCTTSSRDNAEEFGAFGAILAGAAALAIALSAGAAPGRRRGRPATRAAYTERTS